MHEEVLLMDAFINPHAVPHFVTYAFLASLILIAVSLIVRSSLKLIPTGTQNFMETIVEALDQRPVGQQVALAARLRGGSSCSGSRWCWASCGLPEPRSSCGRSVARRASRAAF